MKKLLTGLIKFYQGFSVRFTFLRFLGIAEGGGVCKFTPTCSNYTYQAIEKYGSFKGAVLGLKRIVRCHPWSLGGYDPTP